MSTAPRHRLSLVGPADLNFPAALADENKRRKIQELTEQLVDGLIEMMDLMDGDPDQEANGEEFEDDGV